MFNPDSTWETIPLTNPPPSPNPNTNSPNPPPYVNYAPYTYPPNSDLQPNSEKSHMDNKTNAFPTFGEYNYHTFPPPSPTTTTASNEPTHPGYFETLDFSDYLAAPIDTNNNNSGRRGRQAVREGIAVVCVVLLVAVGLVIAGWAVAGGVQGLGIAKGFEGWGGKVLAGGGGGGKWGPCTAARPRFCYIIVGGGGGGGGR